MQIVVTAILAISLYLAGAFRIATPLRGTNDGSSAVRSQALILLCLALLVHGATLYTDLFAGTGIDLGIFKTASLAGWCIGGVSLLILLRRPIDSLAVVIFPTIACTLVLSIVFRSSRILPPDTPLGLQFHIVLSILAYALFAIATVQAIYFAVAEYKLRHHRPSMAFLPPLPTMETVLFQLTACAFVLLTLSLVLGSLYIADVRAQHLTHKIAFSVLAWAIFASLLIGRYRFQWRGRRAIKFVVGGFVFLAIGFFGSKLVLELVLHRV